MNVKFVLKKIPALVVLQMAPMFCKIPPVYCAEKFFPIVSNVKVSPNAPNAKKVSFLNQEV